MLTIMPVPKVFPVETPPPSPSLNQHPSVWAGESPRPVDHLARPVAARLAVPVLVSTFGAAGRDRGIDRDPDVPAAGPQAPALEPNIGLALFGRAQGVPIPRETPRALYRKVHGLQQAIQLAVAFFRKPAVSAGQATAPESRSDPSPNQLFDPSPRHARPNNTAFYWVLSSMLRIRTVPFYWVMSNASFSFFTKNYQQLFIRHWLTRKNANRSLVHTANECYAHLQCSYKP